MFSIKPHLGVAAIAALIFAGCATSPGAAARSRMKQSLTFHAGFDGSTDAAVARGDRRIQVGPQWGKPRPVSPGLPPGNVVRIAPGEGRFGDALRFERKVKELVGYQVEGNIDYKTTGFDGTVSYWLKLDPDADLEPGYCDTVQITSKDWNDAAFFTEFSKDEKPREFRLGMYPDLKVWNADNRNWDTMAWGEKPHVAVKHPPFSRDRWTHVVFTWKNFNTGRPDGVARLYLDGVLSQEISARAQTYTWDLKTARIMLGLSYTGLMDDVAIFNCALTDGEVKVLHQLKSGVAGLQK